MTEPPSYVLSRRLFLRALGAVYGIAFLSLSWQVLGLFGNDGLRPVAPWLERVHAELGSAAYLQMPTILWLGASDKMLEWLCLGGAAMSLLAVAGLTPRLTFFVLWILYVSLVSVGDPFLSYQWDALLLEAGFLAILWAPDSSRLTSPTACRPSRVILWCFRLLLFRLMFFSGWVKLQSGDPAWWNLTALEWHYQTQPLPAWTSWYAHQLPAIAQKLSCGAMLVVELGAPFLIFAGRSARLAACAAFVGLQIFIGSTGNYGFFNLLSAALCLPLLDDGQIRALTPSALRARASLMVGPDERLVARTFATVGAALVLCLGISTSLTQVTRTVGPWSSLIEPIASWARPFRIVNRYGLFAVMTKTRPEVTIEGSDDGETWKTYVFRWKPGPLDRRPDFVEPDMPRLDWQMWFDGLHIERILQGGQGSDLATPALLQRLGQGSESVLGLLGKNPFPDQPPRFLRWRLDDYRFTDWSERERTGAWWTSRLLHAEPARSAR